MQEYIEIAHQSGQYQNDSLVIKHKFDKIEKAEQLRKLKQTYQNLQKEVQTYDDYLKATTSVTKCTDITYGYDSTTYHYRTSYKCRVQAHVVPTSNDLNGLGGLLREAVLQNPDAINFYRQAIMEPILSKYREKNKAEFNIVNPDDIPLDEISKKLEEIKKKKEMKASMGIGTVIFGGLSAYCYWKLGECQSNQRDTEDVTMSARVFAGISMICTLMGLSQ